MIDWNQVFLKTLLQLPGLLLQTWQVWLTFGLLFAAKHAFRVWERRRLAASGLEEIDVMDGRTFEKYLEAVFLAQGYRVELTPYVGDYGADLVIRREGPRTLVQAKRYKNKVGVKGIQEAFTAKARYGCEAAMVITNSTFSRQAVELARVNNVILWDRSRLITELLAARPNQDTPSVVSRVTPSAPIGTIPPGPAEAQTLGERDAPPDCPTCAVPMTHRTARRGPKAGESFWGCPNYPRCRQIVSQ